jgi:CPA1 family monovalent cation:H+ antiporter
VCPCRHAFIANSLIFILIGVQEAQQHILFWGGLRGALALALSLSLPRDLPHHDAVITITFAVVAFSVFAQGLTITPLLRRLGQLK